MIRLTSDISSVRLLKFILPLSLLLGLFGIAFSGFSVKSYDHLLPSDVLNVAGKQSSVKALALLYAPTIRSDSAVGNPEWIWYDAVVQGDRLRLAYFPTWRSENHPNKAISLLYSLWRFLYYGGVRDIEYIAISINFEDGIVTEVEFESPEEKEYRIVKHNRIVLPADDERTIAMTPLGKRNGMAAVFQIASWNHLFRIETMKLEGKVFQSPRLEYLDGNSYVRYKMRRRSEPSWME